MKKFNDVIFDSLEIFYEKQRPLFYDDNVVLLGDKRYILSDILNENGWVENNDIVSYPKGHVFVIFRNNNLTVVLGRSVTWAKPSGDWAWDIMWFKPAW